MIAQIGDGFELSPAGGALVRWRVGAKNILFPQQEFAVRGQTKLRGGMFWCFPNFGTPPSGWGLPQHGTLRQAHGNIARVQLAQAAQYVEFAGNDFFGKKRRGCSVLVLAKHRFDGSIDNQNPRVLEYELRASLPKSTNAKVPLLVGAHPYFATPEGVAGVRVGSMSYPVRGLIEEARFVPWAGQATIEVPGIGTIEMSVSDSMRSKHAGFYLWRDSLQYVCALPVMGRSEQYGDLSVGCLTAGRVPTDTPGFYLPRVFSATVTLRVM